MFLTRIQRISYARLVGAAAFAACVALSSAASATTATAGCCTGAARAESSFATASLQEALDAIAGLVATARSLPSDAFWADDLPSRPDPATARRVKWTVGGFALLGILGSLTGILRARAEARAANAVYARLTDPRREQPATRHPRALTLVASGGARAGEQAQRALPPVRLRPLLN